MLRLWLNNEEAELKPDETIATTLQVNDVEKPESFQSSFTNTFDLPLTRVNRRILGNAQANGDNNTLRTKIPARLENSGFSIVSNGFAVVNEINNNTAKITVYDGIADFFTQIGERKLSEVDLVSLNPTWNLAEVTANTQNSWTDGYVWALANYGNLTSSTVDVRYQYPSIFVKYLFQEIASQFTDYTFINDGLYTDTFFESLALPFHNDISYSFQFFGSLVNANRLYTSDINDLTIENWDSESLSDGVFNINTGVADYTNSTGVIKLNVSYLGVLTKSGTSPVVITIKIIGQNTSTIYASQTSNYTTGGTKIGACNTGFIFLKEPVYATLSIAFAAPGIESFEHDVSFFTNQAFENNEIPFGSEFPLNYCLPNIKIKDFIKDIWSMFGVMPKVDNYRKTISLQRFEQEITQKQAIDYSNNIDISKECLKEYQYGGYALSNEFKWGNEDLKNELKGNGSFLVNNALLPESYEWISLNLGASDASLIDDAFNVVDIIVLDDTLTLDNSLNARLTYVNYYSGSPIPAVNFTDGTSTNSNVSFSTLNFSTSGDPQTLDFNSIRSNYHTEFIKMIQKMEKVTVFLYLNAKEFNNLDFFKPVYLSFSYKLGQISGMFLIQKVEDYEAGKAAKTELVKLNPF